MALRVAINGFGRIGRCVLRSAHSSPGAAAGVPDIEIVHINDLTSPEQLAHLLTHDSVHGTWNVPVKVTEGGFTIAGKFVRVTAERDPAKLPWRDEKIDVVLECTGLFTKRDKAAMHLDAGARRVIISAPGEGEDITVCLGVNDDKLDLSKHFVISNASCTTNCLAPVAKVLDQHFGIEQGLMTTIHSYTMDQNLLDAPHKKDLRRARAAALNMVPTSTGAAKAVGLVLPELKGKLSGLSIRVPTPNVSLVDLVITTRKPVTKEAINNALIEAATNGPLKGILLAVNAPLVSGDLNGNPASSIVDLELTSVMGDKMAKVLAWYDNEWGFSNRMVDLCRKIAAVEGAR